MTFYQERLLKADININTAGDNTIIVPGAGEMPATWENGAVYIVIDHINLVPAAAVTVQLKNGTTNYGGAYPLTSNQGFVLENAIHSEVGIITLGPNKNFVINLSAGVQVSGFIRYRLLMTN